MRVKRCAVGVGLVLASGWLLAQSGVVKLPEQDRVLARDIFKQLVEINSQDSNGSVTAAATSMRERLLTGGFTAEDLVLAGPNAKKQNLVVWYRGKAGSGLKPVLIICHLDVVEARKEDWTTDPYQFIERGRLLLRAWHTGRQGRRCGSGGDTAAVPSRGLCAEPRHHRRVDGG